MIRALVVGMVVGVAAAGCVSYREQAKLDELRRIEASSTAPDGRVAPAWEEPKASPCCVHCKSSQPCGSSCIPYGHACHVTGGCAC